MRRKVNVATEMSLHVLAYKLTTSLRTGAGYQAICRVGLQDHVNLSDFGLPKSKQIDRSGN